MIDLIGWIGTFVFVAAAIFVAHKNIVGMWLMLVGNILFGIVGVASGLTSLIGVSVIMAVVDFYGIYKWGSNEDSEKTCRCHCKVH